MSELLFVLGCAVVAVALFLKALVWVIGRSEERAERREAEERHRMASQGRHFRSEP